MAETEFRALYQRLTEKFRTLWVFQQFQQELSAVLPSGEVAGAAATFSPIYEEIKKLKASRATTPVEERLTEVKRLDVVLEGLHTALLLQDRKVPPHVLRQYFEKSGRDVDGEIVPLLKYYFYARQLAPDDLDKVDFLLTRVGTRRLPDGGLELKPATELAGLCATFLSLTRRDAVDPAEVQLVLSLLEVLRKDIEACERFEDLIRKKPLENIRTLKRRMGKVFYSAEVLQSLLASNVAAKRKFQLLYRKEEERILSTSRRLLDLEAELSREPRYQTEQFQADFRRFRRERDEFEKQTRRRGVRTREVRRLKEAIYRILVLVEPSAAEDFDVTFGSTTSGASARAARPRLPGETPVPRSTAGPSGSVPESAWSAEDDSLTRAAASKILHSADLMGHGVGPARAASGETPQHLRLESWEVQAALALARRDETPSRKPDPIARLLFNAATLRLQMDEEAAELRSLLGPQPTAIATSATLDTVAKCLAHAQEIDWLFRTALLDASGRGNSERHLQLTRSRFRHLRAYTGLWLLHNALGG
ncbi:MAG: hypothetical protein ACHQPI_05680 [Thermoanaerobaculia bacterium]